MPIRFLVSCLLLPLLLVPSTARAYGKVPSLRRGEEPQGSTVSVPANLYSLEELAAKLSLPNAPVKASSVVARRVGFARLKEHSQTEALHLIELAFALKAKPQPAPEQGFVLVEDPDNAKRERRWMNAFIPIVQKPVRERLADAYALSHMAQEELIRERDKRERAMKAAEKYKHGTPSADEYSRLYDLHFRAMLAAHDNNLKPEPYVYLRDSQNIPVMVEEAVRRSFAFRTEAFMEENETAFTVTRATFEHTADGYSLEVKLDVLHPDRKEGVTGFETFGHRLVDLLFGSAVQGTPDSYPPLLGKDAAEWMAKERARTDTFLAMEAVWKPFTLDPDLPSDAISSRTWQWCKAMDKEALVEVIPSVDASEARGKSFADELRYRDYWSARDEGGVAIITNRLAFLDRSRGWNVSGVQYLAQAQVKAAQEKTSTNRFTESDDFPLSLLPTFTKRVWESGNYVALNWPGINTSYNYYYGYEPETLDDAAAIGMLWDHLPRKYAAPVSKGAMPSHTEVALNEFDESTLRLLAQWLENTGSVTTRHAAFMGYLREKGLLIWEPVPNERRVKAWITFGETKSPLRPENTPYLTFAFDR